MLDKPLNTKLPYIEPVVRSVAGALVTLFALLLYSQNQMGLVWLLALLFIGLNLFQSGLTGVCFLEIFLTKIGFRSELDEIRTLRQKELAAIMEHEDNLRMFNMLSEAIMEFSPTGKILMASEAWWKLLGSDELVCPLSKGKQLVEYIHSNDVENVENIFREFSRAEHSMDPKVIRFRVMRQDGRDNWVEGKFVRQHDVSENPTIQGILRDVTDDHIEAEKNQYLALHDVLTGLPNRVLFQDRLQHSLIMAKRNQHNTAVLYIDIDNFKQVNDAYGHRAGDQMLAAVSSILQSSIRESDTLARWGGDEFILLLPAIEDYLVLQKFGDDLRIKLEQGLTARNISTPVTLSIGGAIYDENTDSSDVLLDKADMALYLAKRNGRNNVQLYSEDGREDRVLN